MRYTNDCTLSTDEPINAVVLSCEGGIRPATEALCVLGVWAVTIEVVDVLQGSPVYGNRCVVTHTPTGFRLGNSMTERDAMRTLRRLYDAFPDFLVSTTVYEHGPATKVRLGECFPVHAIRNCKWYNLAKAGVAS